MKPRNQVYAKKSQPSIPSGGPLLEGLQWLTYPQSVLNKVKTSEELRNVRYTAERSSEGQGKGCTSWEYIPSDDEEEDGWETLSEEELTSGGEEWEEQLVYVELNDVPSIQELFAVQPDDFQRFLRKRYRQRSQPVKATHPKVTLQLHQFQSSSPVLQIGHRYFNCRWEEPTGSAMFFRKTADGATTTASTKPAKTDPSVRPSTLRSIVPEPTIPWDDIFGAEHRSMKNSYEVVALADKVLRTELLEADSKKMNKIPTNRQFFGRPGTCKFKVPQGYTATDLLAGEYRPKRTYVRKRRLKPKNDGSTAGPEPGEQEIESREQEQTGSVDAPQA